MQTKSDSDFGFWSKPLFAISLICIWAILLVFFRQFPAIDLAIATYFYDPTFCAVATQSAGCIGFPIASNVVAAPLREFLNEAPYYLTLGLAIWILTGLLRGKRWSFAPLRNKILVLATVIVGPILIVNAGLKDHFGRVRPRDIIDFGGVSNFTLPGDLVGQCASNCSFVSGEASSGAWLLCLGLLFPHKWRTTAYIVLFIIGASMALLRVAFGAHFISDVILGYLSTLIVMSLLVILSESYQSKQST